MGSYRLGFSIWIVVWDVAFMGGGLGAGQHPIEGVMPMFAATLAFGLTALASRPARPVGPDEMRELRRAMVLLDELEHKLANR